MERKIEAFIFDLDGVITDTAELHYQAWKKLAASIGIVIDRIFNERLKGVSRTEALEKILVFGNRQHEFTDKEKQQLANVKNEYYKQLINTLKPTDVLPGIYVLLEQLKTKQIKIGLASASQNALTVIERLDLSEYLDCIVDAGTIKHGKPHPEIFIKAADMLQVPYDHCVGIEDAAVGIEAIKAAGMFAVGIGDKMSLGKADLLFPRTECLNFDTINNTFLNFYK